jgi:hypothetical protein
MPSFRLQEMAQQQSSANGPSLGPRKERQHDARITVLSSLYGSVNAQCDERSASRLLIFSVNRNVMGSSPAGIDI